MSGPISKPDPKSPPGGSATSHAKDAALRGDPAFAPARDLLRGAAKPRPPTASERAAILAMAAQIGAGPVPPGPRSGAWSRLSSLGAVKSVGIAAFALVVGGAAWFGLARTPSTPAPPPSAPVESPSVVAPPSSMPVEAPSSMPVEAPSSMPVEAPSSVPVGADAKVPVVADAKVPVVGTAANPGLAGTSSSGVGGAARSPTGSNVNGASALAAPPPKTGCPVSASPGDRSAEGPMLAAAAKALGSSPLVTLACVQALSTSGGPYQLRDEHAFLGFEASRRLGREADAKRYARALLKASPTSAYAAKARAYLGE